MKKLMTEHKQLLKVFSNKYKKCLETDKKLLKN